ncbi:MAG TPA: hypothetical protein DCX52_08045 [Massilia sp.]|nr:hypothetical protein [Massilia sp.]
MSTCSRCGARFGCAMVDGGAGPCWCTELPPALPVPGVDASCWCPACLRAHIEERTRGAGQAEGHEVPPTSGS